MISRKAVGSMTLVILTVAGIRAFAEEQTAAELYGQGMHAYFANDYDSAMALMGESIEKNALDPRPYYFRGLAQAARDGLDSGLADLAKGAELEMAQREEKFYNVNGALQRVQGSLRLELEKQRSAARLAAAEKKKKQDRVKYERLRRREDIVLFDPERPIKKINLELPKVELKGGDPFATGVAFSGGKEVESAVPLPTESQAAPEEPLEMGTGTEQPRNPFGGTPPENPFGDTSPPEDPKVEAEENPFGESNPFGAEMGKVDPEDPVFNEDVPPEMPPGFDAGPEEPPGTNVGGAILDLLGKTLSGESNAAADRDPFADNSGSPTPPKVDPEDDAGSEPAKKDDPGSSPFD